MLVTITINQNAHQQKTRHSSGSTQAALVGGVLVCLVPHGFTMLARSGLMAADGRCKVHECMDDCMLLQACSTIPCHMYTPQHPPQTLDVSADGYGRGEACRTLLIGTPDAHHRPLAILSNSAVNSNGTASTLTAPHGPSQQALLLEALRGTAPSSVMALQLHANGTQLGDAVEVNAALSVLFPGEDTAPAGTTPARPRPLLLHTCKGATGHQEAASGIASLQEALAVLHHHATAPALHLVTLNPHVETAMTGRATQVARQGQPVAFSSAPVAMGVSSFGAQGTNAHAVLVGGGGGMTGIPKQGRARWQSNRFWALAPVQVC